MSTLSQTYSESMDLYLYNDTQMVFELLWPNNYNEAYRRKKSWTLVAYNLLSKISNIYLKFDYFIVVSENVIINFSYLAYNI